MIDLRFGDCRSLLEHGWGDGRCVVLDPPWDAPALGAWAFDG